MQTNYPRKYCGCESCAAFNAKQLYKMRQVLIRHGIKTATPAAGDAGREEYMSMSNVTDEQVTTLCNAIGFKARSYCDKLNNEHGTDYNVRIKAFSISAHVIVTTRFCEGKEYEPKSNGEPAAIMDRETGQFVKSRLLKKDGGSLKYPKTQPKGMPAIDDYELNFCGDIPKTGSHRYFLISSSLQAAQHS